MNCNNKLVWIERMVNCFEQPQTRILVCMSNLIRTLMSDPYYAKRKSFVEEALRILCALSYEQQIATQGDVAMSFRDRYQMRAILYKEVVN